MDVYPFLDLLVVGRVMDVPFSNSSTSSWKRSTTRLQRRLALSYDRGRSQSPKLFALCDGSLPSQSHMCAECHVCGIVRERAAENRFEYLRGEIPLTSTTHVNSLLDSDDGVVTTSADEHDDSCDATSRRRLYWNEDESTAERYSRLGHCLAACGDLYRGPNYGDGLLLVTDAGRVVPVTKGADLAPVIVDRVDITVVKGGKSTGSTIAASHLNAMLRTSAFLRWFRTVDIVSTSPIYGPDFRLARPGYNDGPEGWRALYLGAEPEISYSKEFIDRLLGVLEFATQADRTNALAALLLVALRHHWPGAKPIVVVTATKSHAGKDTVIDFASCSAKKTSVSYQKPDWPVEEAVVRAIKADPEIGVISVENARVSGRDSEIVSAFIERLVTEKEPFLTAPGTGQPVRRRNEFVVAISTNHGTLSKDIMNRALPIHLEAVGNVAERRSPIGNPRYSYLPENRDAISAEVRGMIDRWIQEGMPLDETVQHSFNRCTQVIGGILRVNGYEGFLGNYSLRRTADDPVRNALGLIGAERPDEWLRPGEFADIAADLGLTKDVIPNGDRDTTAGRRRGMGTTLSNHMEETFEVETDDVRLTLRLQRLRGRFGERNVHVRYRFETLQEHVLLDDDDAPWADSSEQSAGDVELSTLA